MAALDLPEVFIVRSDAVIVPPPVVMMPPALSPVVVISESLIAVSYTHLRKLQAVEGLGSVSVICSDKTGTLTQNKMTVEDYYVCGEKIPASDFDMEDPGERQLLLCSVLCNDSAIAEGREIGDPTETALINSGTRLGMSYEAERKLNERYGEIPFDSERKLMSTCHVLKRENAELFEDTQKVMITKGAVDVLLGRVAYIKTRDGVRKITQSDREAIEAVSYTHLAGVGNAWRYHRGGALCRSFPERSAVHSSSGARRYAGRSALMRYERSEGAAGVFHGCDTAVVPIAGDRAGIYRAVHVRDRFPAYVRRFFHDRKHAAESAREGVL